MRHDPLNDAISTIKNAERTGKSECMLKPATKLLVSVLHIFQENGYIGEYEVEGNRRGGSVRVKLIRHINDCGVIKPRFPVKNQDFIQWEKRYLPSRGFGLLVVTTPQGVMSHEEAKDKGIGGRLIAYAY
ncbi:MAG: 30S ribosomal protein S8 [Candidatus Altiarchaeales archaeon]|nr:30S ribosomal protein S8 [Candidatus Altiarchaeales archaeon]MBD3415791.1 30S ribosomal protein S8 [Candidatus Altiarchaeales archaeon]